MTSADLKPAVSSTLTSSRSDAACSMSLTSSGSQRAHHLPDRGAVDLEDDVRTRPRCGARPPAPARWRFRTPGRSRSTAPARRGRTGPGRRSAPPAPGTSARRRPTAPRSAASRSASAAAGPHPASRGARSPARSAGRSGCRCGATPARRATGHDPARRPPGAAATRRRAATGDAPQGDLQDRDPGDQPPDQPSWVRSFRLLLRHVIELYGSRISFRPNR